MSTICPADKLCLLPDDSKPCQLSVLTEQRLWRRKRDESHNWTNPKHRRHLRDEPLPSSWTKWFTHEQIQDGQQQCGGGACLELHLL